ncbi:MAG: hypothetical protein HY220_02675 [Candidatus Sungbacteria bacterium]|uniref:Tetratricopeptide repeat protein n=1 Tax=Candidatus Sungiibacteriota bacterium TaxID=2750080 RepID=A0A9D6QVM4_9BACT|nr:hypothetical protein [Candidatus Sungbacteria bacterium]
MYRNTGQYIIAFLFFSALILYWQATALARVLWGHRWGEVAVTLDQTDAKLASGIGAYYFNGGAYNLDIAEKAYRKAVTIDPRIFWGHYQLARIYFIEGKFDQAISETAKELGANPGNLRTLYVRGLIYGTQGDLVKAEDNFRRFTEWAPSEWAGYNDLAWVYSKDGKFKEAKETIRLAMRKIPNADTNPWLWNALGVAELNLGEKDAQNSFESALNLAHHLSLQDWYKAYPGNQKDDAAQGLDQFKAAIKENLRRSEAFR